MNEDEYDDELTETLIEAHKKGDMDLTDLIANFVIYTTKIGGKRLELDEKSKVKFLTMIKLQFIADTLDDAELKDFIFGAGYTTINAETFFAWASQLSDEEKQEIFLNSGMANEA